MGSAAQPVPADHPVHYERYRPEHSLLYQLVEEHFPAFKAHLEAQGTALPHYVEQLVVAITKGIGFKVNSSWASANTGIDEIRYNKPTLDRGWVEYQTGANPSLKRGLVYTIVPVVDLVGQIEHGGTVTTVDDTVDG